MSDTPKSPPANASASVADGRAPVARMIKGGAVQGQGAQPPAVPTANEAAAFPVGVPTAKFARMRPRHWGLVLSLLVLLFAPLAAIGFYLYVVAQDQYASTTGFTVRQTEGVNAAELFGGIAEFAGAGGSADADILYEFILSQEMVRRLDARLDLTGHYSAPHGADPIFALAPDATIEDLVTYWGRMLRVSFDQSSGLIELRVLAFDPVMAQRVAENVVEESQTLVNELNASARADAMAFAEADLQAALIRLRAAREAMTSFRTRTQIVDPESDLQGRMGVLNTLQQQLAEALIEYDILFETTANPSDPRLVQAERRIEVIRGRITQERATFTMDDVGTAGEDYPTLMAEYEGVAVDREYAEESYRVALTALDVARANAARETRYLAVFIRPTLPESAEFPRRETILALAALFLGLGWAIMALVWYAIRDRQ